MYYALDIPDHRVGISWEEVTKLFDTSAVTSQWLESLNRVKKFIIDELEGNVVILLKNINTNNIILSMLIGLEILDVAEQIDSIKEAFESSITNNSCRKRNAVKHFKHMLYLAEVI